MPLAAAASIRARLLTTRIVNNENSSPHPLQNLIESGSARTDTSLQTEANAGKATRRVQTPLPPQHFGFGCFRIRLCIIVRAIFYARNKYSPRKQGSDDWHRRSAASRSHVTDRVRSNDGRRAVNSTNGRGQLTDGARTIGGRAQPFPARAARGVIAAGDIGREHRCRCYTVATLARSLQPRRWKGAGR